MEILKLYPGDIKHTVELRQKCWNEDFKGILPHYAIDIKKETEKMRNWLGNSYSSGTSVMYGAYNRKDFWGYLAGYYDNVNLSFIITELYIYPDCRGLNLSYKLLRYLLYRERVASSVYIRFQCFRSKHCRDYFEKLGCDLMQEGSTEINGRVVPTLFYRVKKNDLLSFLESKLSFEHSNCPYCGFPLTKGTISTGRDSVKWYDSKENAFKKFLHLGGETLSIAPNLLAFRCRKCDHIIVDVPMNSYMDTPEFENNKEE